MKEANSKERLLYWYSEKNSLIGNNYSSILLYIEHEFCIYSLSDKNHENYSKCTLMFSVNPKYERMVGSFGIIQ